MPTLSENVDDFLTQKRIAVDLAHKCMRWWLGLTGGLPK
jgi:hypothetical protein